GVGDVLERVVDVGQLTRGAGIGQVARVVRVAVDAPLVEVRRLHRGSGRRGCRGGRGDGRRGGGLVAGHVVAGDGERVARARRQAADGDAGAHRGGHHVAAVVHVVRGDVAGLRVVGGRGPGERDGGTGGAGHLQAGRRGHHAVAGRGRAAGAGRGRGG